jgi:hypothetical protein
MPNKKEYIAEINSLLNLADLELIDFIYQLLQKSVPDDITPLKEHQQIA